MSAIVGCVDAAGRVLIVRQTSGPFEGAWLLPGGRMEQGEGAEEAARRELLEETGYTLRDLAPVAEYDVRSAAVGGFHFSVRLFRGGAVSGSPRPEPGGELRWVDPAGIEAHPSLAVELIDLGLIERDRAAVERELRKIGVEMRRVR